jgi:hypothetical protein
MIRFAALSVALTLVSGGAIAADDGLPPVPDDLLNKSALACIQIDDQGKIIGAFLLTSLGAAVQDKEAIDWTRQLHWGPVKLGDKSRNIWFPIGLAWGSAKPPPSPATCGPPGHI